MILDALSLVIRTILDAFLQLVEAVTVAIDWTPVETAFSWLGVLNEWIPVSELFWCLGIVVSFNVLVWTWKAVKEIWSALPFT